MQPDHVDRLRVGLVTLHVPGRYDVERDAELGEDQPPLRRG
jgi:hypothetical protein